ncbi:uncharacterized protein EI97DRAFT_443091 [Westerdykella ornata]|uniref:gamma-glutamylcyclotransferase n=1 Tax=Westerdykella ornata TaxID=318751 RepID=A0A6A6JGV8_WESOR|nr:uncharacterized protein EI97DRAFT_443091 [Westerdykella ornata]KAF2275662.1 hypothetical protein EI97DRAFT_443091 [Westerdykella ornata]
MGSISAEDPTIYFGFGSNLWLHQMELRCPTSKYLGLARLSGYKWIINDRGYANVVQVSSDTAMDGINDDDNNESRYANVVFGLVYSLLPEDESRLDENEGVPVAYTKELLPVDFWRSPNGTASPIEDIENTPPTDLGVKMLVYIDRRRTTEDAPRKEYVYRMNRGIEDALKMGVPEGYVEGVLRRFIPSDGDGGKDGEGHRGRALEQARGFRDESGVF